MIDIATLSQEARLTLIEQLWDSLAKSPENVPVSNWHKEELDRRIDEIDRDGPEGIPAAEVFAQLKSHRH